MDVAELPCLTEHGAQLFAGAAVSQIEQLCEILSPYDSGVAGVRITGSPALAKLLARPEMPGAIAADLLRKPARPVRAILFDKNPASNWSLAWHQDRTICVTERIETPGFGPWTRKQGLLHVQPPFPLLERMVTLRIHIDPVDRDNAPLMIALGSHGYGRISEPDVAAVAANCGSFVCLAEAGDIWAYATPILHGSASSHSVRRRRVLQVDYSADLLPNGLEWLGI